LRVGAPGVSEAPSTAADTPDPPVAPALGTKADAVGFKAPAPTNVVCPGADPALLGAESDPDPDPGLYTCASGDGFPGAKGLLGCEGADKPKPNAGADAGAEGPDPDAAVAKVGVVVALIVVASKGFEVAVAANGFAEEAEVELEAGGELGGAPNADVTPSNADLVGPNALIAFPNALGVLTRLAKALTG
jgi:hypothetical protein